MIIIILHRDGVTYKIPTQKISTSAILCLSGLCTRHSMGNGKASKVKSRMILMIAVDVKNMSWSMHSPSVFPYHAFSIGEHWKRSANVTAIDSPMQMPMTP